MSKVGRPLGYRADNTKKVAEIISRNDNLWKLFCLPPEEICKIRIKVYKMGFNMPCEHTVRHVHRCVRVEKITKILEDNCIDYYGCYDVIENRKVLTFEFLDNNHGVFY